MSWQNRDLDPWICQDCKKQYPVPSLARDCEERHLEEATCPPNLS